MTEPQKIVMDLLGQTLFKVPFAQENYTEIDWEKVKAEASKQMVIPTTVEAVPKEAPREVRVQWIRSACEEEAKCYRILCHHSVIDRLMAESGIPYVILKGAASGAYYPSMHLRHYGDVDFLIPESRKSEVLNFLKNKGFEVGTDSPYEIDLTYHQVAFDLHTSINGIPEGTCGESAKKIMAIIIDTSLNQNLQGGSIKVPDELHHGMVLLLHTAVHMVGFGIGLRQLCDWAVFANHMGDRFGDVFEESLKQTGLWHFAQVMSAACTEYLHMPEYDWCKVKNHDLSMIDEFMEEVLRKGSLMHTGEDDIDSVFMREPNKGGIGKGNMLTQGFRNVASKVKYQWPVMDKYKVLIPFGMILMFFRYIYGVVTGTYKKISLKETVSRTKKRKEFYEGLDLFMEEDK